VIKVSNDITVYEIDGKETSGVPLPKMSLVSHWNRAELIILIIDDKCVTVTARDLRAAIDNATNVNR